MAEPEIERLLVLSTTHITEHTCNTCLRAQNDSTPVYEKGGYGWFVYVDAWFPDTPEDLNRTMTFAREKGCEWVMFDSDGPTIEQLPSYDW